MKKTLLIILFFSFPFLVTNNVGNAQVNSFTDEQKQFLVDMGYTLEMLDSFTDEQINRYLTEYELDPEKVQVTSVDVLFDNLYLIEQVSNSTEAELLELGYTKEQISLIDSDIQAYLAKDTSKLLKSDKKEYDLIKKAAEKRGIKYKKIEPGNKVTTSAQISTSLLNYSMAIFNQSSSTAPKYSVESNFLWYKPSAFLQASKDALTTSWSQGFTSTNTYKNLGYRVKYAGDNNWNYNYPIQSTNSLGVIASDAGSGMRYEFNQFEIFNGSGHYVYSGNYSVLLQQNSFQNVNAGVIGKYFQGNSLAGLALQIKNFSYTTTTSHNVSPEVKKIVLR